MAKPTYQSAKKPKKKTPSKIWWILGSILVLIGISATLELTNTTYFFHKKKVPATMPVITNESPSTETKSTPPVSTGGGQSQAQDNQNKLPSSGGGTASTSLPLVEPFGSFVSNHTPGQGGSDMKEQSACDTTPGASCYIQLMSNDGTTSTKLPAQTVGSDGSTIWNWDAGRLTSGEWQVTAVASLNGQTKSATDPTKLVIQ